MPGTATDDDPPDITIDSSATFLDALRSEWTKFRTLRSFAYTLLAATVFGVGTATLFTRARGQEYLALPASGHAGFDPTCISLLGGMLFAQVAVGVLGALTVTSEYAAGTMRTSLTAVPRQSRLLAAKGLVIGVVALAQGEVVGFGSFLAGQGMLSTMDVPHSSLGQPHVLRAITGAGLYQALVGLLGVAVGLLLRSTAGALIVVLATTTAVPYCLGLLAPGAVHDLWPISAGVRIMTTSQPPGFLSAWAGLGVMCVEVAGVLAVARFAAGHRDD